jgi:hypothetical protein
MSINLNHANNLIFASGTDANVSINIVSKGSGNVSITSGILSGLLKSNEVFQSLTGAIGIVTHDTDLGQIFYHGTISGNFTANFTNVSTTSDRATTVTLILIQGATAYIPNAVQIGGSSVSISWLGGSAPSGNANKIDIVTFTFIRSTVLGSGVWSQVLGQLSSFG